MQHEERIAELFGESCDLPAEEQSLFLARECAGQPMLLAELESLLASHARDEADGFLSESALEVEAREEAAEFAGNLRTGQLFGRYKILDLLGEGGMGEVYLAEDTELDRKVAVKVIKSNLKTKEILRRFSNERHILAQLSHENIARLLDVGMTGDGFSFLVMEYVNGRPIDEYCNSKPLSPAEQLKLFRLVCSAVQYAHQNLIIHRDLKPGNILVTDDGQPKLLDFGIAKLLDPVQTNGPANATATMLRAMTPEYASPEQVRGELITTATDVYSLGVLLYELLTGCRPYKLARGSAEEIEKAITTQEPEKPSLAVTRGDADGGSGGSANHKSSTRNPKLLRGDLDNIVLMALRKEPTRRYASVEQFSEDIRRHLEGLPVIARKDTFSYRTSKFIRRNKIAVAAAALILLTLSGGIIATTVEARRATRRFNEVRELAHSVLFDYHDAIAALPGSTAVRQRLVKDGLNYLDNLSKEAGNDTALLRELAAAYEKVAGVQGGIAVSSHGTGLATSNLGDTQGAIENLNKALAIRKRVFALEPNDKDVRQELALCYERIGAVYVYNGPPDKAVESLRRATPILEELTAADPTNEDLQFTLNDNYQGMAKALGSPISPNLGDSKGALEYMNRAQPIIEKLVADHPTNLSYKVYLASAHSAFGWVLGTGSGKWPEALEHAQKAQAIYQDVVSANPGNTVYQNQLSIQLSATGRIMLNMGDKRGALEVFKQGLAICESILKADAKDAYTRKSVALGYRNVAEAQGAMGDYRGALDNFHKSQQLFAELVTEDPANADTKSKSAYVYLATSRVQFQAGDLNGALESALQGIKIDEALLAAAPTNVLARNTLAQLDDALGDDHAKLAAKITSSTVKQNEQWRAAKDAYQKSLEIFQDLKSKDKLSGADASKPDELAKEIAKCDAALRLLN